MPMRTIPWLLALMLAVSPLAAAGEDEENETDQDLTNDPVRENEDTEGDESDAEEDEEDDRDDENERSVHVEVDGLRAHVKLERETRTDEDKIELTFDATEALLEVKYEAEANDSETEQKLRARFHELIEYTDADGDGAYDPGEAIASAYRLGGDHELANVTSGRATWQPIQIEDITTGNVTGKKLESRATFGEGGTFGLVFYVFGDFAMLEGSTLQPTEAKIDILIQHYPYERNDTRLAVVLTLKAEEEFEREHDFVDADEEGVTANGATSDVTFGLVFTWKETARVDGVDTPVHATILKNNTETEDERDGDERESKIEQKILLVLSYARGDDILHDPTAGVSYQSMSAKTTQVPGLAPLAIAAGFVAVALFARRRRA